MDEGIPDISVTQGKVKGATAHPPSPPPDSSHQQPYLLTYRPTQQPLTYSLDLPIIFTHLPR